ncbi:putative membrane protein [Streptomyces spectabilis]|uniref:Putative membrane protein n=1 Tax=Streptomyces spectabilis TaxID=68270 RepID=A0A7W8ATN5_STRST|nr:putative membrane protein [Streptomyces spectabilis]
MSRLRGWRVTHDGAFWGGVLALLTWGTVVALLVMAAAGKLTPTQP